MGRGDIKTKKGKTFAGSFGKVRPAKVSVKSLVPAVKAAPVVKEPKVVTAETEVVKEKKVTTKKAK